MNPDLAAPDGPGLSVIGFGSFRWLSHVGYLVDEVEVEGQRLGLGFKPGDGAVAIRSGTLKAEELRHDDTARGR